MASSLKKISIDELKIGMFVVEMDISWIQSPFLLHRRAIKSKKDINLLKQSGVKSLKIDLNKSQISEDSEVSLDAEQVQEALQARPCDKSDDDIKESILATPKLSPDSLDKPSVLLEEELNRAVMLKKQACESFFRINERVKNNQAVSAKTLEPIIDDTIASLLRNSQALLTLMHLKRYEEKLFSHSFSVMTLALTLAIKDGVKKDDLTTLALAALLHDIGWAQLPLNLFGKVKPYTANELKVVHQHQKIATIIMGKSSSISSAVKKLMVHHHERLDGSGYPEGIKEHQLDHLEKILILTDYYDETIHGLLDRPGLIPSEALRLLYKEATQNKLDKSLVQLLIKMLGIYPLTSAVELTTGEKGVVVEVNRDKPLVPVVKIMYSANGNALTSPLIVDLDKDENNRQVKGIVDCVDQKNDPQRLLLVEEV